MHTAITSNTVSLIKVTLPHFSTYIMIKSAI